MTNTNEVRTKNTIHVFCLLYLKSKTSAKKSSQEVANLVTTMKCHTINTGYKYCVISPINVEA